VISILTKHLSLNPPLRSLLHILTIPALQFPVSARNSHHILIGRDVEIPASVLRPNKCEQDDICVHTAHENANHETVLVPLRLSLGRQRELLANRRFNGGTRTAHKITELVTRADNKRPETTRGEFHEVNGNNAPRALDAELLEECGGNDAFVGDECVWVEQCAAEDAHADYGDAATEDGGRVADDGAAGHGAEVGDDLGDGDGVGGEAVLICEHRGVQVLGTVGHEVEALSH
jgi:hypothetical protein